MAEEIDFKFNGGLSDFHQMDFYEAGRFQYGAARLLVKLDQFRRYGRFSQKITYDNNTRIILAAQQPGSFILSTLAPILATAQDEFIKAPISLMWSYISDRVFKPATNDNLRDALSTQRELIEVFDRQITQSGEQTRRTLDLLEDRIERGDALSVENAQLRERLMTETERRSYLEGEASILRQINPNQEAQLLAMAGPLLKDMGVALRSSATTLQVSTTGNGTSRRILFINKRMANEVDTSRIDDESTLILVKVVQYNTETGWGKLRMQEHQGLLSFNVPGDVKQSIQQEMLSAMDNEKTYIECLFVRSPQGILQRAIIIALHDLDEIEGQFS